MKIIEKINHQHLLIDGAMGTMLQKYGLPIGASSESFNLSHPEIVAQIHKEYAEAGASIITTNTFQCNRFKFSVEELTIMIKRAIQLAKQAIQEYEEKYIAYDMGPTGQLLAPMGTLSFDEAYECFKEQAILAEGNGADLIIIETMSDLLEMKAAILAIKENTQLPIFATMTYQEDGRTFVGTDPISATLTMQALGVEALGVNCSLGPIELTDVVETILAYAKVPVIVQANAGLPEMHEGQAVYTITPEKYGKIIEDFLKKGVRIIGGCCGTTPEFTKIMQQILAESPIIQPVSETVTAITSASQTVILNEGIHLIGERINPTGKKKLQAALRENNLSYLLKEGLRQVEAGADILDVNVGLPEIAEEDVMKDVIQQLQGIVNVPLQIDSAKPEAIEKGARYYSGRPLINSVNGKQDSMSAIFPIVKKYGGVVLGLCLDETGIPDTAEGRLAIAEKIVMTAQKYGISKEDVMIDPLILTASAQQAQVQVTLDTLTLVKEKLGVSTAAGLSNVSFGLPNRELLNSTFLATAVASGLDAPIVNPLSDVLMNTVRALKVIYNQDKDASDYIENSQQITLTEKTISSSLINEKTVETDLKALILKGQKDLTPTVTKELLSTLSPLEIVNTYFIPALNEVGEKFEKGAIFLPQLMQSAEAVQRSQEVLKDYYLTHNQETVSQGKIILATVEGDIHDIGKNIVKMVLENYGFEVIDLGKDVPAEAISQAIRKNDVQLVGLSALMTTTVTNMKKIITTIREEQLPVTFMVGGAVLNEEYKDFVGADYYAKDALESVTIAQQFFETN